MSFTSEDQFVEMRLANWLSQMIAYIAPQHLQIVAGRGVSKTTQIQAERMQEVVLDMPGSLQILVCNTYTNARTNIVPSLLEGFQNYKGWYEGKDFVVGVRPPTWFKRCFKPLVSYKNVISFANGACVVVGSLEMISGLAGNSYQHLYADEVKYDDKSKMNVIFPALRGNNKYPHSPYYLGTTFTTDLPDINLGNHDWIMDYEKEMDLERVKASYYCGYEINKINLEIVRAVRFRQKKKIKKLIANKARWMLKHYKIRKGLSFFYVTSTFANIDALTNEVVYNMLKSLGKETFKQSVLSLKSKLEEGDRFYQGLADKHFYEAEYAEYSESIGLKGMPTCKVLKFYDPKEPLECGMDFGKMISAVFGQPFGKEYHIFKNIYAVVPEKTREWADKFLKFFQDHDYRVLNLYYDRSGNQYGSSGRDWASEVKDSIELDGDGKRTGWRVNLMSRGQRTIFHSDEYFLMKQVLSEELEGLPILRIEKMQCRELKSSMELSKILLKIDYKTGKKTIHKDKSSESLPPSKLPMQSTNMSDALKYLMYREEWVKIVKRKKSVIITALDGM